MKHLIPISLALCSLLLSGCGQDRLPAVAPTEKLVKTTSVKPKASATTVLPQPSTVFANQSACLSAGYGQPQCARALSTADAMSREDRPIYPTFAECKRLFANCSGSGEKLSSPQMVAFSIGNEEKRPGAPPQASAANPLWHEPIYRNAQGQLVFIKREASGGVRIFPVSPKS